MQKLFLRGVKLFSHPGAETLLSVRFQVLCMGPEELFRKCMEGGIGRLVKGGDFYKYFRSPFLVWCDAFAPAGERDPESAYMEMIFENGRSFEDEIAKEQFPGSLDLDPTSHEKAFLQALEALFQGVQYVRNGILYYLPGGFVAVPDVLVRKEGPSLFGDWHYEVVEIKSSKQIKEEHIMQAAYYNHLLGILQGVTPAQFALIDGQKEKRVFEHRECEQAVLRTIGAIRGILQGKQPAPAKLDWPWSSFSVKVLREQQDLSLIPNLYSAHKEILAGRGVRTLQDLFGLGILGVRGIPFDTLERYRRSAKAIFQGRHTFLQKPFLPEAGLELFLDFEGVEQMRVNGKAISLDYLIGVLAREGGQESFIPFVAETPRDEHEMLLSFLKFLRERGLAGKQAKEMAIYHFGPYEKSHLARLLDRYGVDRRLAEKILASMVDILQVSRKSVIFPTHSYALKEIGKYLGFQWKGVDDAKDAIALYLDFLKSGNRESLEKIIQYNQDDCLALRRVKDFLVWGT